MNWFEISVMFGIGVILFFFVVVMFAKYLVRKDKIHQCSECGAFVAKFDVEKHIKEKHCEVTENEHH